MPELLKPVTLPDKYSKEIREKIIQYLTDVIFLPIIKEMEITKERYFNSSYLLQNSVSAITKGIKTGRIQFADGIIKGDFNATITRQLRELGLKYDNRIKGYRINLINLPVSLQVAITETAENYEYMAQNMLKAIDNIEIKEGLTFIEESNSIIDNLNLNLDKSLKKSIGINILITDFQRDVLNKNFTQNMNLYIQEFIKEEIIRLRELVEQSALSGIRAKELQTIIKDQFAVSDRKAKFLARQEVNLFQSTYKYNQFKQNGIERYRWSISGIRTRPDHKKLDKQIFYFNDPPVTNQNTGARNNPQEDYNCNCIAIPIYDG